METKNKTQELKINEEELNALDGILNEFVETLDPEVHKDDLRDVELAGGLVMRLWEHLEVLRPTQNAKPAE